MGLATDGERAELLLRIQSSPECANALAALQGEVLQIVISDAPAEYRLAFRGGTVEVDSNAAPTIQVEARQAIMNRIVDGDLDPLVAIVTRKLKAKVDPVRGPLLRTIFRAGRSRSSGDMDWARIIK